MGQLISKSVESRIKPITIDVHYAPTKQHEVVLQDCARMASSVWNSTKRTHVLVKFANPREFMHESVLSESWQPYKRIGKELFTAASAKHMTDERLNIGDDLFEITIRLNLVQKWYVGSDGKVPTGQHDLITTCLREMVSGLFMYSDRVRAGNSRQTAHYFGPTKEHLEERFLSFVAVETDNGDCAISSYKHSPKELYRAVVSGKLYFRTGDKRIVRLHSPRIWDPVASLIRFHESEGENNLMKPKIAQGEAIHRIDKKIVNMMNVVLNKSSKRARLCGRGDEFIPPQLNERNTVLQVVLPAFLFIFIIMNLLMKAWRRRTMREREITEVDFPEDEKSL